MDPISSLPMELNMNSLAISTSQPQPQSKLIQWKRSTADKDQNNAPSGEQGSSAMIAIDNGALNKAVGSKPSSHQSQLTPNLRYGDLGLANLGGDPTWSNMPTVSSSSQNWPSAIGPTISSTASIESSNVSAGNGKDITTSSTDGGKESQTPITTSSSVLNLNDSIAPEFVPGKPWQGITKSVEDDPHITPGSFSRSYSLSTPREDDLSSLTKTSPSVSESQSWSVHPKNSSQTLGKSWSGGDSVIPTSFSNEVWGVPLPKNNSRPPPGLHQNKTGSWSGVNRQHSWAGAGKSQMFNLMVIKIESKRCDSAQ